jgi:hypothetical protein
VSASGYALDPKSQKVAELTEESAGQSRATASAFMLAVLGLQYGLTAVGQEGIAPFMTAFHALAVFEHGAADLVGPVAFGLLAVATVVTSATLLARQIWRGAAIVGLLAALTLPNLDVLQAGYAFMLPFAVWETPDRRERR